MEDVDVVARSSAASMQRRKRFEWAPKRPKPDPAETCRAAAGGQTSLLAGGLSNGASRARTGDLLGAIQALFQLSYSPVSHMLGAVNGKPDPPYPGERIPYAAFGERFFEHAVTADRIVGALEGIAGDPIEFGPIGAGPGKVAKVAAAGQVGRARATPTSGELVGFRLTIPVSLDLKIDIGPDHHVFHAKLEVNLDLCARAADPLRVVIDIEEPTSKNVTVDLEAEGMRAEVLSRVAGIDREIRRFVAKYVAREIDKPHIRAARDIDVAARIDSAWRAGSRSGD